jgi:hypothetical protein
MKKHKQIFIVLGLLAICIQVSVTVMPLFCKLFLTFPPLEEAEAYKGTIQVEGEKSCRRGKCRPPTYYVVDTIGKHEIYWGYPGDRLELHAKSVIQGATGAFWFHPIFGVIQEDVTIHKNGLKPEATDNKYDGAKAFHSHKENRDLFEIHFDYRKYWFYSLPFFMCLVFLIISVNKLFRKNHMNLKD